MYPPHSNTVGAAMVPRPIYRLGPGTDLDACTVFQLSQPSIEALY